MEGYQIYQLDQEVNDYDVEAAIEREYSDYIKNMLRCA